MTDDAFGPATGGYALEGSECRPHLGRGGVKGVRR